MPKIPLYNEGRGSGVDLAAGQLSPRASMQAFTAPATASAKFFDGLSKVAAEFGQREKSRETDRVYAEELVRLRKEATTFNLENRDTEIGSYEANWRDFQDAAENRIRSYGNLTNSQAQTIVNKLAPDFANFNIDGKQQAYVRGQGIASAGFQSITNNRIERIASLPIGHPDRVSEKNKYLEELGKARLDGLNIGDYDEAFFDNQVESLSITKQLDSASSLTAIDDVDDLIAVSPNLSSADIKALNNDVETARTRVRAESVAALTSTLSLDDIGTKITSVEQIDERRQALLDGSAFADRPSLRAMLNDLDDVGKEQFLAEVNQKTKDMRGQLNFRQGQEDRRVKQVNDDIYTDFYGRIIKQEADAPSVEDINNAPFEGQEGEKLREGLKGVLQRRLSGDLLTDTSPKTYMGTKVLIDQGKIKSITQPFTLEHERGQEGFANSFSLTEGKSLIERVGNTDGYGYNYPDYNQLAALVDDQDKASQSVDRQEKVLQAKAFQAFLSGYENKIKGYSGLSKLDMSADIRMYDFTKYMEKRFYKAIEEGKDYRDLLDPRHPDFLIAEPDKFALSFDEQVKLIGEQLKSEKPQLSEISPPQKPEGMPVDVWMNSKTYNDYYSSQDWQLYKSLVPEQRQ